MLGIGPVPVLGIAIPIGKARHRSHPRLETTRPKTKMPQQLRPDVAINDTHQWSYVNSVFQHLREIGDVGKVLYDGVEQNRIKRIFIEASEIVRAPLHHFDSLHQGRNSQQLFFGPSPAPQREIRSDVAVADGGNLHRQHPGSTTDFIYGLWPELENICDCGFNPLSHLFDGNWLPCVTAIPAYGVESNRSGQSVLGKLAQIGNFSPFGENHRTSHPSTQDFVHV